MAETPKQTEAERMAALKAEVEAYETAQAAERQKKAVEAVAPAREFVADPELAKLKKAAEQARLKCAEFTQLASMLDNFVQTVDLLPAVIDRAESQALAAIGTEGA